MEFNPGEVVQTRSGLPARIIALDVLGDFPIVAAIKISDNQELVVSYGADGRAVFDKSDNFNSMDLVNPTIWKGCIAFMKDPDGVPFTIYCDTRETLDARIKEWIGRGSGCIKIQEISHVE